MKKSKRVLVVSDFHCGHRSGLTPPAWQSRPAGSNPAQHNKYANTQKDLWGWYAKTIKSIQPIDILIVNGDAIDGRGERSGSTELIATNRQEQVAMAVECIKTVKAESIVMTYGTPYHTGYKEDWEACIADRVKAEKIGAHEWIEVNGIVIDIKHKIGRSELPHTRHTAIARDHLWNELWAAHDEQPRANILIRSHVHYFTYAGSNRWLAITTPALQSYGTKYGARECTGKVDVGLIYFDIEENGEYTWTPIIAQLPTQKVRALKL